MYINSDLQTKTTSPSTKWYSINNSTLLEEAASGHSNVCDIILACPTTLCFDFGDDVEMFV